MNEQVWLISEDPTEMMESLRRDWDKGEEYYAVSDRKLRLYACACWRHLWTKPHEQAEAAAVEVWVDGGGYLPEVPAHWVNQPSAGAAAVDAAHGMWPNDARRGADLLREIVGNPFRPLLQPCGRHSIADDCPGCRTLRTPTVLSLAHAAYDERPGRKCSPCNGAGEVLVYDLTDQCATCNGKGRIEDDALDPLRLMVLADALEEAGCPTPTGKKRTVSEVVRQRANAVAGGCCNLFADNQGCDCLETAEPDSILAHLRSSPGPHVRGCWVLDLLLGKN